MNYGDGNELERGEGEEGGCENVKGEWGCGEGRIC